MKRKILILGSSGFIGRHLIEECLKQDMIPVLFDRYTKYYADPENCPDGTEIFSGDVRDRESVEEAIKKCNYAINLAGILGTQETINDPIPSIQTNVIGAVNFLEACKPTAFHNIKAVQIGVGNYWMNNSYSITKDMALRFCMMYNKEHKTKVAMVRALNAYGEYQKAQPIRKIIPTFINKALNNENIEIYGDGSQVMDMIYVKDLCRILIAACIQDHNIYNKVLEAGTGRPTTVNWIADTIIKACGSDSKIIYLPMRPGEEEKSFVCANPDSLKVIGFDTFTRFEDGIDKTIKWYKGEK